MRLSDAKQWLEGQICISVSHTHVRFFFLYTFDVQTLELERMCLAMGSNLELLHVKWSYFRHVLHLDL